MTKQADILARVTGVAHLITANMVKEGATVFDFGFTKMDSTWVSDADYEDVKEIADIISPVPGGTGPMTNVMLMRNTLTAAQGQARLGVRTASRVSAVAVSPTAMGEDSAQASS